eukprot:jgi/Botrbrau1/14386/Bobra.0014s0035.1
MDPSMTDAVLETLRKCTSWVKLHGKELQETAAQPRADEGLAELQGPHMLNPTMGAYGRSLVSSIGKKRSYYDLCADVEEHCQTLSTPSLECTQFGKLLKKEIQDLVRALANASETSLPFGLHEGQEHDGGQMDPPTDKTASHRTPKPTHKNEGGSSIDTASQQSGKTLCGEQRHETDREVVTAPTIIRRQSSRRRLDLDIDAIVEAHKAAQARCNTSYPAQRLDRLAAIAGGVLEESNEKVGGEESPCRQQCTDSDNSSSGWTMRSSPAHMESTMEKLPNRAASTGLLGRGAPLSRWGGSNKRNKTKYLDAKREPLKSSSLTVPVVRKLSTEGAEGRPPIGMAVPTPSPERLGKGLRRQPMSSPLTTPELQSSHDVLSGTDTPPPGPWKMEEMDIQQQRSCIPSPETRVKAGEARSSGGIRRDSSRLGAWSPEDKHRLVKLVEQLRPYGASSWEVVADRLGRWSPGGASAERMYRTLTDPGYQRSTNKHGRRINSRKCRPMHVMAAYALQQLPNRQGNLNQIAGIIADTPEFKDDLDWSARPGTKTYPRWKDALVGCFKQGRYPHLFKNPSKVNGLNIYYLDESKLEEVSNKRRRRLSSTSSRDLPEKLGGEEGILSHGSPTRVPTFHSTAGASTPLTASPPHPACRMNDSLPRVAQSGIGARGFTTPPHVGSNAAHSLSFSPPFSAASHVCHPASCRTTEEEP